MIVEILVPEWQLYYASPEFAFAIWHEFANSILFNFQVVRVHENALPNTLLTAKVSDICLKSSGPGPIGSYFELLRQYLLVET